MFTAMLCDYRSAVCDQGSQADVVQQSGSQFFALIARHPDTGNRNRGEAYACECLQQHDAAARRKRRGRAATRSCAQRHAYGRHCDSGLRRLRGTLKPGTFFGDRSPHIEPEGRAAGVVALERDVAERVVEPRAICWMKAA